MHAISRSHHTRICCSRSIKQFMIIMNFKSFARVGSLGSLRRIAKCRKIIALVVAVMMGLVFYAVAFMLITFCHGATLYASPDGTDSSTGCPLSNPCSLAGAVSASVAGDTIVALVGTYTKGFPLIVAKDLNVVTQNSQLGVTFDGGNATNLIIATSCKLTLDNIALVNGFAANGGAVFATNSTLNITSCNFHNNVATSTAPNSGGGAIFANNTRLVLAKCMFTRRFAVVQLRWCKIALATILMYFRASTRPLWTIQSTLPAGFRERRLQLSLMC
jgi:hypothetical protein